MSLNKDEARKIIDNLPENATWDDLIYQIYVKKRIETALQEIDRGDTLSHEEVKQQFLS